MDPFAFQAQEDMLSWSFWPAPFDLVAAVPDVVVPIVPVAAKRSSAFVNYSEFACGSVGRPTGRQNIHRRVIGFLRRITAPKRRAEADAAKVENNVSAGNRTYRHTMRERQRREKLSQGYAELCSVVRPKCKADKNSILQSAAMYLRELKRDKEEVRQRNDELRARLAWSNERQDAAKIKLRLANPTSAIDSIIGALRCLKDMDAKINAVGARFSGGELTTVMSIETKVMVVEEHSFPSISANEVERAMEGALVEVERRLPTQLPRTRSMWGQHCHVENPV